MHRGGTLLGRPIARCSGVLVAPESISNGTLPLRAINDTKHMNYIFIDRPISHVSVVIASCRVREGPTVGCHIATSEGSLGRHVKQTAARAKPIIP